MDSALTYERRYFWRRGFAYVLDVLLASIIAGFLLLALSNVVRTDLGASSFTRTTICNIASPDMPLVRQIEREWPLKAGEVRVNQVCRVTVLGLPGYDFFHSQVEAGAKSGDGPVTFSFTGRRTIGVLLDAEGKPATLVSLPNLSLPLVVLIFAFFTVNGKRSPGKMILSLRAVSDEGRPFGWKTALTREALKFLPLWLLFAYQVWVWLAPPAELADFSAMIATARDGYASVASAYWPMIVIWLVGLVWWIGPFIFWRGATWYDWIAGTKVVGTARTPSA